MNKLAPALVHWQMTKQKYLLCAFHFVSAETCVVQRIVWIYFQYSSPLGYVTPQRIIEKFELTCFCIVYLLWGSSRLCWNMFREMPASINFFCAVPVTWFSRISTIRILFHLCWNMCRTTRCLNILPILVSSGVCNASAHHSEIGTYVFLYCVSFVGFVTPLLTHVP